MDLRKERGLIGKYNGLEVHVVSKKDFDSGKCTDKNIIYVLTDGNRFESLMVSRGVVIGHIDPQGGVTEYTSPFDYITPKKAKAKPEKREEVFKAATTVKVEETAATSVDAESYLRWAREKWDPISLAKAAVNIEVKPIAVG